jgi:plastocyanin
MNITLAAPHAHAVKRTSPFSRLVVGALVGIALMYVYVQAVLIKAIEMPLPIFSVISLLLAALVAGRPVGGWRWTPLLGTVWSLFLLMGSVTLVRHHLAHPEDTLVFASQLVMLGLNTTAAVAGIGATVQNYRRPLAEQRLPRWVGWGFVALTGLFIGAVAVASIPQTGSGVQIDSALRSQLPAVPLDVFNGGEIRVKAGELTALRLQNPDGVGHSFDVDALNLHVAMPSNSESVALFRVNEPGRYLFICAPHYNKATGNGMQGTLIVE